MADENHKEVLRKALSSFDTVHLHKLMATAYDRWTWDTDSDVDKQWFEVAEELLKERGMDVALINNNAIQSIGVTNGDFTIKSDKLLMENTYSSMPSELFEWQNGKLQIAHGLKEALVEFLVREIESGVLWSTAGKDLGEAIGDVAIKAMKEKL